MWAAAYAMSTCVAALERVLSAIVDGGKEALDWRLL
jgi:hypothetical protein